MLFGYPARALHLAAVLASRTRAVSPAAPALSAAA
jgi:hypothetical protein